MPITLCVLLWPVAGHEQLLIDYEDQVLLLLPAHGARLLTRVRTKDAQEGEPLEVHVLEFPSEQALADYLDDPQRAALASVRERVITRTQLLRVEPVN